jgi:tetratricopeptide (TPR) repeat protein
VALTAQQERVSLSLSLYDLEDPRTLQAIVGLGEVYRIQGLLADARTILDIVVSAVGDLPERTDAQTAALASALHNLGLVFAASDPGNAREVLHEALAHLEQVVGPDHPAVSRTHMALGLLDRDQGREQEARSHWEIALKPLPEDDPLHHRLEALLAVTA